MGDLIQYRPRSNAKADRAFWIGPEEYGRSPAMAALPYLAEHNRERADDLTQGHADPEMVSDTGDCA